MFIPIYIISQQTVCIRIVKEEQYSDKQGNKTGFYNIYLSDRSMCKILCV